LNGANRKSLPEGWDYTAPGLAAAEQEAKKFEEALLVVWIERTKARASKSLDAADCRDAARFLMTNYPMPAWKRSFRIALNLLYLVAGYLVREAFVGQKDNAELVALLIAGCGLALAIAFIQETLLQN
jgi:hypothetical protein